MQGWVWITEQLLQDGAEVMIMPALTNKRISNAKRIFRFGCDAAYYILRWYII